MHTGFTKIFALAIPAIFAATSIAQTSWYIEAESIEPTGSWKKDKSVPGYTGSGYMFWDAGLNKSTPTGILEYTFDVKEAGLYNVQLLSQRNKTGRCVGAKSDECNDVFSTMNNGKFYKTMVKGTWGEWEWGATTVEATHGKFTFPDYQLSAGKNVYKIAGRSEDVRIDAIAIFKKGTQRPESGQSPVSIKTVHYAPETFDKAIVYGYDGKRLETIENSTISETRNNLKQGLYFISLQAGGKVFTQKLAVH